MKLGGKLQRLRKKSGLSQEQLAARLTVSRQAVSKWELDETVPDTENVVQLSRLFGVSCDYLLRDEVDEPGPAPAVQDPPQPTPPGEAHLTEQGWIHNASVLSLAACAIGLVAAYMGTISLHSVKAMALGLIIQVLGIGLFELAAPRMGDGRTAARLGFYATACWLILPILIFLAFGWISDLLPEWHMPVLRALATYFAVDVLTSAAVTAVLLLLRRRYVRT